MVTRDAERNPIIEGIKYRQASKISDLIEDKYGLGIWRTKMAMSGVARDDQLREEVAALDPSVALGWPGIIERGIASAPRKFAGGSSATRGTKIHAAVDRANKGLPLDGFASEVDTFQTSLDSVGLKVVSSEVFVAAHEVQVAGTYDVELECLVKLGPFQVGDKIIGDLKTGKNVLRNGLGIAMQLAVYAQGHGQVRKDKGIVIHMPADEVKLYLVDLTRGWEAVKIAVAADEARKYKDLMEEL